MATKVRTHETAIMTTPARLQPVQPWGWRRGLGNLLGKEFGAWWRTPMAWVHALIWLVVINGMVALVAVATQLDPEATDQLSTAGLSIFFIFGGLAAAVGAIITTQGAIIGERQLGTAAWILSKPAARSAFILAKLIAHSVGLLGLTLVLQAPIAIAQLAVWTGQTPPLLPFLAGVGVLALHLLFYLTLTLMLGVLFRGRGQWPASASVCCWAVG